MSTPSGLTDNPKVLYTASLLFLSGTLPVIDRQLTISGRFGENIPVEQGRAAARLAALNALAAVREYLGDLDRIKKLVKLTGSMVTTEGFTEHAAVADGASELFDQVFGARAPHTRGICELQSLAKGAPVVVETVFETSS